MKTLTFKQDLGNNKKFQVDFRNLRVTMLRYDGYDLQGDQGEIWTPVASTKITRERRDDGLEISTFRACARLAEYA